MSTNSEGTGLFPVARSVQIWLCIGLFMIFMQVVIGGVTRLTGSGLSITKWEIVEGSIPPLNTQQWDEAFELYKATPQYQKINEGMSMGEFKFIYFWEFLHRLWARTMGFVFAIPFVFFWMKGLIPRKLARNLGIVILLAALVASLGWIMVASGLINRPWVNAYKLSMHLSLAFVLYGYLLWTTFISIQGNPQLINIPLLKRWSKVTTFVLGLQIILGGIMSGMKAALFYPTWPDMNGSLVPNIVLNSKEWNVENFINYDVNSFMPALIQLAHRSTAYLLIFIILYLFWQSRKHILPNPLKMGITLLVTMLFVQILLGILTVINSMGIIPVSWGVLHQAGALVMLSFALFVNYQFSTKTY